MEVAPIIIPTPWMGKLEKLMLREAEERAHGYQGIGWYLTSRLFPQSSFFMSVLQNQRSGSPGATNCYNSLWFGSRSCLSWPTFSRWSLFLFLPTSRAIHEPVRSLRRGAGCAGGGYPPSPAGSWFSLHCLISPSLASPHRLQHSSGLCLGHPSSVLALTALFDFGSEHPIKGIGVEI